jgi:hypothetical protein
LKDWFNELRGYTYSSWRRYPTPLPSPPKGVGSISVRGPQSANIVWGEIDKFPCRAEMNVKLIAQSSAHTFTWKSPCYQVTSHLTNWNFCNPLRHALLIQVCMVFAETRASG